MEKLKELVKELILIDSSTMEGANQAVDFCCQWLMDKDLPVSVLENNGYKMLVCEIGSGEKTLILNGHVDVVSGKQDQFIPVEQDGKIFGRGAADMKAGVAAMMYALSELKDHDLDLKLQLQIVSDEETGGTNCSGYLVENGYRGDFVICAEPTQLGIALQAKGTMHIDIELPGKAAHSSRPWEGENAIRKACGVYEQILELPFTKESSEFYPSPSVNLSKIEAGEVYNKVPDSCKMYIDIRYLPGQTPEQIAEQVESVAEGSVSLDVVGKPVEAKRDDPFIMKLKPAIEKYTKNETVFFGQHGAADTQFFCAKGIPAVEFGPSGQNWHGDDEFAVENSIYLYEKILVDYILSL